MNRDISYLEWLVSNVVKIDLGNAGIGVILKDVGKLFPNLVLCDSGGIDISRVALDKVERTNIIQACGVISMRVGKEYRIQMSYLGAQHLLPEIRPGVYHQHLSFVFDKD